MTIKKIIDQAIKNWPIKAVSVGLALFLVIFHRMSSLEERFFSIPLNIERSGTLVPSSHYPRMIRINIRGESNSLFSIMEDDIEAYIDLSTFYMPGVYTIPIQWRKRGTPAGMEPVQITVEPAEITLQLDRRISKVVPLTAVLRGQVDSGYSMTQYSLYPHDFIIEGPAGLISGISDLTTEAIDLDGRRSDFSVTTMALSGDPLVIIRGSGAAEFRATIRQVIPVRNIANVPIAVTGLGEHLSGALETVFGNIRLEGGSQDALDRFTPGAGFLRVDASEIDRAGIYILDVLSDTPEHVIIRVEPEEVRLHVSLAGERETP